jgi:hypothetical protein
MRSNTTIQSNNPKTKAGPKWSTFTSVHVKDLDQYLLKRVKNDHEFESHIIIPVLWPPCPYTH